MLEIVVLGSGAGFASSSRFNPSVALLIQERVYLLDCGEPCSALLYKQGIDLLSLRGIFVSHTHPDHIGGLPQLLFSMHLLGRNPKVKYRPWSITRYDPWYTSKIVYPESIRTAPGDNQARERLSLVVPLEAVGPIRACLPVLYLAPEVLPYDLELVSMQNDTVYADGTIQVRAVKNRHIEGNHLYDKLAVTYPDLSFESYSFVVEAEGRRIVYSGDIDRVEELTSIVDRAELLIVEAAHVAPEDLIRLIEQVSVPRIVITHVHPGLEDEISGTVANLSDPRLSIAHDGYRIAL